MILLARSLSLADFGYFSLIQSTLGVFAVFAGAGLGVTATRYLAECRHGDLPRAGRIVGLVWSTTFVTVGMALITVLALARWIGNEVAEEGDATAFAVALAIGGIFLALQAFRGIQDGVLMGLERFRDCAALRLAEGLAVLAIMPVLAVRFGLIGAVSGQAVALALVVLAGHGVVRNAKLQERIGTDWSGWQMERPVLRGFALPALLSGTIAAPVLWLGVWMLSRQPDGIAQVALYNAAYQWHGPLIFIPMVLCASGLPIMVQAWAARDIKQFRRMFAILILAAFGFGLLPALGLIHMRETVMGGYGPEYLAGQGALVFLLLAAPLHAAANIGGTALQSMGRAWIAMGTTLLWATVFLVAMFRMVHHWGATGLAAALVLAYLVLVLTRLMYVSLVAKEISARNPAEAGEV